VNWIYLAHDIVQWRAVEYGNEHLGSVQSKQFLDQLSDNQLLKNNSAP
jgi:hypothetical protein